MSTLPTTAANLLANDMTRFQKRLNGRLLGELEQAFQRWHSQAERKDRRRDKHLPREARARRRQELRSKRDRRQRSAETARGMVVFLGQQIESRLKALYELSRQQESLRLDLATHQNEGTRQRISLDHAELLGASRRQLRADRKALRRWFGEEAILDRYLRRRGETEQRLAFALDRLGNLLRQIARSTGSQGILGLWRRLNVDEQLLEVLAYPGDCRVHVAAVGCYQTCLDVLTVEERRQLVSEQTVARLQEYATNELYDVWLQCQSITVLAILSPAEVVSVLKHRLSSQATGDDIFVRRHVVRTIVDLSGDSAGGELLEAVFHDKSVFVRQQLAASLWRLPGPLATRCLEHFLVREPHPQVIASTLAAAPNHTGQLDLHAVWLRLLPECFSRHDDSFVLRTALYASGQWLANARIEFAGQSQPGHGDPRRTQQFIDHSYESVVLPAVRRLQSSADSIPVRRWAAQAGERIWLALHPQASGLYRRLAALTHDLRPGQVRRVPKAIFRGEDRDLLPLETLGRVLAVMAQDDFGFDLRRGLTGYWLMRQPVLGNRVWRILHELRHSATDKRQGFSHTIGRVSRGTIRIPSQILGELSRTKVPGEPFLIPTEGSWRPYLPLADDFVSALNVSLLGPKTVQFFTGQGITRLTAPSSLLRRLWAWLVLCWRFPEYAERRDWQEGDNESPNSYLSHFERLGFRIEFSPYADRTEMPAAKQRSPLRDDSVTRFFPAITVLPAVPGWDVIRNLAQRYASYFSSVYDNTLQQLLLFSLLFALLFVVKHLVSNWRLRRARNRVPLCLGGWGTRGKSGTERLKAALIGALGHGMVSKTTGCEAMFIHADSFGEQLEIPLYRPYDKATIWEHADVIRMAGGMQASVFLWECMGLNPAYVDVLQRQWSVDDLSTITNTYPDHEDIQGPAGYNVANTIAGFAPRNAHVITTEQEMRPIVRRSCEEVGTTLRGVGWLESGLIPDEVLDRFPYKEHPDNIALVAAMADELGVEYDFALKAMADRLVPDLGVLKTYPLANIRSRGIEFTNGMSANERFGCLGNWQRLRFDQHNIHEEPDIWVSTVVNNRADRVARSRVFSSILVNDIAADRHFLIGTNLKGLAGFISDDLDQMLAETTLAADGAYGVESARTKLAEAARRYRQPTKPIHVVRSLQVMLRAVGVSIEDDDSRWADPQSIRSLFAHRQRDSEVEAIVHHHTSLLQAYQEYGELDRAISSVSRAESAWHQLDTRYRALIRNWFERKLVVIEDPNATGEQIIERIVRETPPGVRNRVMGMQNIKGTGLDFIYRFQDWNSCHAACEMLRHHELSVVQKGLDTLTQLPVLGQLCEALVCHTIQNVRGTRLFQSPTLQAALDGVARKVEESTERIAQSCRSAAAGGAQLASSGLIEKAIHLLEEFLDVNDAIRRRARTDLIYADLAQQRISRQHAIVELRRINKRQKGGWLARKKGSGA